MTLRGALTFTFDDGYEGVYQHVLPLLNHYHFPGVFAVPLDQSSLASETGEALRSWQQWQTSLHPRHEMAAHSATHANLTTLSSDALTRELTQPQQSLSATTLIYPGGAYNETVLERTRTMYQAARTVHKGFASLPPSDPWQLPTYNFTRKNFSTLKANALALWACLTNQWLIETYHIVDDQSNSPYAISLTAFEAHLRFVTKLPIRVTTIREMLTSR